MIAAAMLCPALGLIGYHLGRIAAALEKRNELGKVQMTDTPTHYATWWYGLEWCVIAHERISPDAVVSVQFNPPRSTRYIPNTNGPRMTTRKRELEPA